jgi:glutaredoxin-related protein
MPSEQDVKAAYCLQDEDIRSALKTYSNWPTYPQLYVKGELIGGCDIIEEMAASGELTSAIKEAMEGT